MKHKLIAADKTGERIKFGPLKFGSKEYDDCVRFLKNSGYKYVDDTPKKMQYTVVIVEGSERAPIVDTEYKRVDCPYSLCSAGFVRSGDKYYLCPRCKGDSTILVPITDKKIDKLIEDM